MSSLRFAGCFTLPFRVWIFFCLRNMSFWCTRGTCLSYVKLRHDWFLFLENERGGTAFEWSALDCEILSSHFGVVRVELKIRM